MVESIVGALLLAVAAAVVVFASGVVLAGLFRLLDRVVATPDRGVLPSHYGSQLHTDAANYPGYCTECGARNDPNYRLCKNCASRLPSNDSPGIDPDAEDAIGR